MTKSSCWVEDGSWVEGRGQIALAIWRFGHLKGKTMKSHVINEKRNTGYDYVRQPEEVS